jgi:hypothetical protein
MPRDRIRQEYCAKGHLLSETAHVRENGKRSCSVCQKERREELKERPKIFLAEKRCGRCEVPKPLNEFYRDASKPDGVGYYCKVCERWIKLLYNYGVTEEEYNALYAKQGGCCAICGHCPVPPEPFLVVDHVHDTEVVRGLLCGTCNTGLGMLKENPEIVEKALEYLYEAA